MTTAKITTDYKTPKKFTPEYLATAIENLKLLKRLKKAGANYGLEFVESYDVLQSCLYEILGCEIQTENYLISFGIFEIDYANYKIPTLVERAISNMGSRGN